MLIVGRSYDRVFRPEAREREDPREREPRYDHRPERYGHSASESPHLEEVVGVHRVDDAARAEEEERLEEGVVVEVEDAARVVAYPQSEHHVPELGDGGVGDHTLYVPLD